MDRLTQRTTARDQVSVTRMLGHSGFAKGNATDYVSKMRDTRLCLQIAGLSTECYRLYESLDAGCVPILIDNIKAGEPNFKPTWKLQALLHVPFTALMLFKAFGKKD